MRFKGIFASSSNPEQLSKTVQGFVIGLSSIIIFFGLNFFGITITTADVTDLATGLGTTAGGIWMIYGLIMKFVVAIGTE